MNRSALLFVAGLGCASFAACGGADQTTLFDDAGQPVDSTAPDVVTGKDGGNPQNDAAPSDDGPTVIDVTVPDVSIGPADTKIHCGTTSCSAQSQVCCATVGTTITYACVASAADCADSDEVPISCSSDDNCASQGNAGYICCGDPNGPTNPNAQCNGFSTASQVQCAQTCDTTNGEFQIGCNLQTQNCIDTQQQCITSQCTLPGYTLCR